MSDGESELRTLLRDLGQDLRKQGRASIAAQAAAEACLDALRHPQGDDSSVARRWLETLIPSFDALDRALEEAQRLASNTKTKPWWRLGSRSTRPADPLAHGLLLVARGFDDALERLGVELIEPRSGLVQPERHRVVEVVSGHPPGRITKVVRRGYALGSTVVREADVQATANTRQ